MASALLALTGTEGPWAYELLRPDRAVFAANRSYDRNGQRDLWLFCQIMVEGRTEQDGQKEEQEGFCELYKNEFLAQAQYSSNVSKLKRLLIGRWAESYLGHRK